MRFAFLYLWLTGLAYAAAGVQPRQLRCEYRVDPVGIDAAEPRLSWVLAPADPKARGLSQKAYRILAASSESKLRANAGDLWDTGRVDSSDSIQVVYRGKQLTSGAAVFWKVQVWDQDGQRSDWSAPATWSMGLLDVADWQGKWIGRDEPATYRDPASVYQALAGAHWIWDTANARTAAAAGDRYFRETFAVPADRKIAHALCVAGADNTAEAFVNGARILTDSGVTLPAAVDCTRQIHAGDNTVAVHASHAAAGRPAGLIGAVLVEFAAGDPLLVQTGSHWRVADAHQPSPEEGWEKPDSLDSAWQPAKDIGAYGVAPWGAAGFAAEHRLPARLLRKEFTVDKKVARAMVYYSGLGISELYINGAKAGDHVLSPGLTDYDKHVLYVAFDVTKQLSAGRNALGLMLGNGRYYAPRGDATTRSFGYPKARLQLNIEYEDGTHASVVSDESWKLSTAGPIRANNEYDGEEYDARMELPGWHRAGFDDSRWEPVQVLNGPGGALSAQMAEPLRVTDTIKPVSVKRLKPGVYIFDMGQNMVGWCRIRAAGAKGTRVTLRHAETLNRDGSLYVANLRTAKAEDIYTLKGEGTEVYEPRFTYHGFRYVEVTGLPSEPTASALEGRVVNDDMERQADFTSSNALLNQIHKNMFWGIRGNYRSIPTDCPQRDERQGWLGDRSQVSRGESYMFDVAAFYAKWMTDIADSERPDGSIPDVAPNYWPLYNDDLTWPGTFLFVHGMLYDQYGDRRALERNYPAMKRWIAHERGYLKDNLISKDQYADWCVPPEDPKLIHSRDPARVTDKTLIASSYYYELLQVMARFARILDQPTDAAEFESRASQIAGAFERRFFKLERGGYDNGTQTASILPLYFNMVPADFRQAVVDGLVANIHSKTDDHVGTGLVGAQWLMRTLSDTGHADLAYKIATQKTYPGWGYMAGQGATTIWELWNGNTADPAMNSGNHVMQIGDLAVWMYEYLAGIRSDPEQPGFRHTIIRPYPVGDLTYVKASHKSMYGTIVSSWKRGTDGFTFDVTVPANTTATVWVPASNLASIKVNDPRGVKFLRSESGYAIYDVGSGTFSFRAP